MPRAHTLKITYITILFAIMLTFSETAPFNLAMSPADRTKEGYFQAPTRPTAVVIGTNNHGVLSQTL